MICILYRTILTTMKKKSYLSKIGFRKDSLLSNVSEKKTS